MIKELLNKHNINYEIHGTEIRLSCLFTNHEHDTQGQYGFHINTETSQYHCFKCGEKGNIYTLCEKLGWDLPIELQKPQKSTYIKSYPTASTKAILNENSRIYLNKRGVSDQVITDFNVTTKSLKGSSYIAIPIEDSLGVIIGNKLRECPEFGNKKLWEQKGSTAQLFGFHYVKNSPHLGRTIVITEGELDALAVISQGIAAVSSTGGASTWNDSWSELIRDNYDTVYVALDNDEPGKKGSKKVAESLWKNRVQNIYIVNLPSEGGLKDMGEFIQSGVLVSEIIEKYTTSYPPEISTEGFVEMGVTEIAQTLDPIIKLDNITKVALLYSCIGVFTEKHVVNVAMNGQSSTGKTFIVKNIIDLFPEENVITIGNASKKAFIHQSGEYDKENNTITIDLENKIVTILDAPSTELMETLRSFLSQDAKEIIFSITDKNSSGGQQTKNVKLRGPASFILCTAGLHRDEQESTRLLVLSPEVNSEKTKMALEYRLTEAIDHESFKNSTVYHESVILLKKRILAIKYQEISHVDIPHKEYLQEVYMRNSKSLEPRHVRDFHRFKSLVAGSAMFNYIWRSKNGHTLTANRFDIDQAGIIWEKISEPQNLGIAPYVLNIYFEIVLPCFQESGEPITLREILTYYYKVKNSMLNEKYLRNQILPQLETAGMIEITQSSNDKRIKLITPLYGLSENNSSPMMGVEIDEFEEFWNRKGDMTQGQDNDENIEYTGFLPDLTDESQSI